MNSVRIPLPDLEHLTDEQRKVADEVASGRRGEVRGPVRVWLHSPELASRAQKLGEFLRWGTTIEPRISELVILVTARHYDCRYMLGNHKGLAVKAGISEEAIAAIESGLAPAFDRVDEAAAYQFASEILRRHAVCEETLAKARTLFGDRGVIEIGAIIGHYHSGAIALAIADTPPPAKL